MKQQESTFWPVVAMLLAGALIIVGGLAWSEPWDGWDAVSALGGWAAAGGSVAAVVVALRVATSDARWREAERERKAAEERFYVVSLVPSLVLFPSEFERAKKSLRAWAHGEEETQVVALESLNQLLEAMKRLDLPRIAWVCPEASTGISASMYQLGLAYTLVSGMSMTFSQHDFMRNLLLGNLANAQSLFDKAHNALVAVVNKDLGLG